ncbi:MAG TPA: SusC/RagA family TonB-linked outer membrane protein [Cyclobacteriaceae bacterium]|nr:SusC/RagA family TonB-linked outer membrane protein [Cyclobacteriaceae bacterium]
MKRLLHSCVVVMLMLYSVQALAQDRTVTGRVTSTEDGSPIPGVNVLLKGTSAGTATDADGKYSLPVPASGGSLIFSFIGLESKEIAIGDRAVVDVSLALDVTQLSEVVVTALGVERETKTLGFSVAQVSNEELTVGRTTNVVNALSGKVAGVRVAGSNGMTGSSSAIFIRGFTTFTGSNQPLFVVDGIPIDNSGGGMATQAGVSNSNRAIDINQDDIETMSILKGPAAAVLYGSRAASGAIIITTKKGKGSVAGKKTTVDYTGSYNVTEPNRLPDYQNEYGRGTSLSGAGVPIAPVYQPNADQSNWGPIIAGQLVPSEYSAADQALFGLPADNVLTAYPNNVEDMFIKGYNAQHNVAFSGGNEKANFYFSYNNLRDKGFMEGNFLERNSFRFNGSNQFSSKFNMGVNVSYINSQSERSQTGNQLSNPLFRGWFLPRDYDLKNSPYVRPDGSQVYFNNNTDHPYWTLKYNLYNDEVNRIIGNVNWGYDFTDWLGVNYKIGTDAYTLRRLTYDAIGARGGANHGVQGVGAVGERTTMNQETSSYLTLNLKKQLTDDINLTALIGNELNLQVSQDYGFVGNTLNTRGVRRITDANNFTPLASSETRKTLIGVFADVQANYKGWAYLGLTGRNDWSSTFKSGNNSYFYPSVTSSLILSEAIPALKNNILNFAKIKANWAKVGREAGTYDTDTYWFTSNPGDGFGPQIIYPFLGQLGRSLGNAAGNAELGPEFTRSYEVGIEAGFLQDKIRVDLTYFNTRSTDIILNVPIASASGFTSQTKNAGVLETNGIELTLGATPVKTNSFRWDIDINWSRIRNNVISLADGVQNIGIGGFTTAQTRIEAGKEYGVIYANSLVRDANGDLVVSSTTGLPANGPAVLRGNPNPRWTGGITNTVSYKGITLSFLIDIRHGGDILSRVINDVRRTGTAEETAEFPRFESDGVTPTKNYIVPGVYADGTPNTIPVTAQEYFQSMFSFANPGEGVFDASWVRLREASLFYSLPKSLLEKTPFGKVEIGVNGRNLLLKTDVPHIDPETNLTGASNSQGLEFNTMPNARSYGAVLRFTF